MFLQYMYLNNQHENITFTLECETCNALSYLDVKVSRENNKFIHDQLKVRPYFLPESQKIDGPEYIRGSNDFAFFYIYY